MRAPSPTARDRQASRRGSPRRAEGTRDTCDRVYTVRTPGGDRGLPRTAGPATRDVRRVATDTRGWRAGTETITVTRSVRPGDRGPRPGEGTGGKAHVTASTTRHAGLTRG